jgi:very-short-patch-repair endonuclease
LPRTKQPRNVTKARKLRHEMSLPEVMLWRLLRGEPEGIKLRRQHPLGPYVLDFYCASRKLAFEIDGFVHATGDRPQRDARRDAWLKRQGIEVVRIAASDVFRSPEDVAASIVRYCRGR